jgi:hypothetical protein
MDKEKVLIACGELFAQSGELEPVVKFLKGLGLSKVESMICIVESGVAPMSQAKEIVHNSDSWAERREADDAFHEQLHESLDRQKGSGSLPSR